MGKHGPKPPQDNPPPSPPPPGNGDGVSGGVTDPGKGGHKKPKK